MPASLSPHSRRSRFSAAGGGLPPVVIVLAALAISAVIFFVFTRPALDKSQAAATAAATPSDAQAAKPTAVPTPQAPQDQPAKAAPAPPPAPAVPPAPPSFGFARPQDVGKEMLRSLAAGDYSTAGKLAATADPAQAEAAAGVFEKMLKGLGARPGSEDQVELLGMVENRMRVAVPLLIPGQQTPVRIQLDLERDERMGWKIARLQLPKELNGALAAATPTPAAPVPAPTAPGIPAMLPPAPGPLPKVSSVFALEETQDALSFGSDFVRALLKHDFVEAKKFVDEKKVPAERLVGLCIVFEEGAYEFKPAKPLIITVANPEVSWVIAQVQSQKLQQSTEFGMELQRTGIDQPWKVVGLNLSEILSSFAASAAKMGVPYTPIVSNPKGGESLALYFEYDQAALHPRAQKQLEIVSGLLKSDPARKLHIAGHTDAKGTDSYNIGLSQSRAQSVKQQLVALGVPDGQVITSGLGKAQPLSPNKKADGTDDPEGRSKNRRAEIYLDF